MCIYIYIYIYYICISYKYIYIYIYIYIYENLFSKASRAVMTNEPMVPAVISESDVPIATEPAHVCVCVCVWVCVCVCVPIATEPVREHRNLNGAYH